MTGCPDQGELLGGYVLGALESEEMDEMRRHLEVCPRCAREARELSGLPRLLDAVEPEDVPPPVLPAEVEERVLDRFVREGAAARRPARRPRVPLAAAAALAAAVLVAVLLVVGLLPGGDDEGAYATAELRGSAGSARAELTVVPEGTRVSLSARGLPAQGAVYELWCVGTDGSWVSGGTFRASADGSAKAELTAAVRPGDYHRIVLTRYSAGDKQAARAEALLRGSLRY